MVISNEGRHEFTVLRRGGDSHSLVTTERVLLRLAVQMATKSFGEMEANSLRPQRSLLFSQGWTSRSMMSLFTTR